MNLVCVPPQNSYVEIPVSQCDGIWSWGLWEIVRFRGSHEGKASHDRISAIIRRERDQSSLSFCHLRTQQESGCLKTRRRALIRHQIYQCLDLGLPTSSTVRNKRLLFKVSSLWYFCYSSLIRLKQGLY